MDPILDTPLKKPSESSIEQETTPQTRKLDQKSPNSIENTHKNKNSTPDILKVPKAFKHPERYMSPTDLLMSPVSKGLLARARKTGTIPSQSCVFGSLADFGSKVSGCGSL